MVATPTSSFNWHKRQFQGQCKQRSINTICIFLLITKETVLRWNFKSKHVQQLLQLLLQLADVLMFFLQKIFQPFNLCSVTSVNKSRASCLHLQLPALRPASYYSLVPHNNVPGKSSLLRNSTKYYCIVVVL